LFGRRFARPGPSPSRRPGKLGRRFARPGPLSSRRPGKLGRRFARPAQPAGWRRAALRALAPGPRNLAGVEAVRILADEIGPRAAGSSEEGRAAQWCAGRLAELGLDVGIETFASRRSARPWLAAYLGLAALGALLTALLPLAGFVLSLAALP
jgi:hypothetical protein